MANPTGQLKLNDDRGQGPSEEQDEYVVKLNLRTLQKNNFDTFQRPAFGFTHWRLDIGGIRNDHDGSIYFTFFGPTWVSFQYILSRLLPKSTVPTYLRAQ